MNYAESIASQLKLRSVQVTAAVELLDGRVHEQWPVEPVGRGQLEVLAQKLLVAAGPRGRLRARVEHERRACPICRTEVGHHFVVVGALCRRDQCCLSSAGDRRENRRSRPQPCPE